MVALDIITLLDRKQRWEVVDLHGSIVASTSNLLNTAIHSGALQMLEEGTVSHIYTVDRPIPDGIKDGYDNEAVIVITINEWMVV